MQQSTSSVPSNGLVIALTGKPGDGKTRILLSLAAHQHGVGQLVEGFVAVAGARTTALEGANDYKIRFLRTGEELPWAVRDWALTPPYRFDSGAFQRLQVWVTELSPQSPLVLLDEFSKLEARGEGLMPLWASIEATHPHITIIAVRDGYLEAIEQRLGRKFDLCVSATDPAALSKLTQACAEYGEWTRIGLFGGAAGGIELSIGSFLHASKIPFRGLVLSSLQGAMMTFSGFGLSQPSRVIWIPFISAGLKSLTPAGNRFRPMVAISVQGGLFGISIGLIGWNIIGVFVGGALIGAWSASQGFFLQYLMLGGELLRTYEATVTWLAQHWHITAPQLPWLLGGWIALHAVIGGLITFTAWQLRTPPAALRKLIQQEEIQIAEPKQVNERPKWQQVLRDFGRWQFFLPLTIVGAISALTGHSWESIGWLILRFLTFTVVLTSLLSLFRPAKWADQLRRFGWWGPSIALRGALERRK